MSIQQERFREIADAIREKTGETVQIRPTEFAAKVGEVYESGLEIGETVGYGQGYDIGYSEGRQTEYDRFWDAYQQNGTRTDYYVAFWSRGWSDVNFKPKYPMKPTSVNNMAAYSRITGDLREKVDIDFSNCTVMASAFYGTGITHMGVVDMRKNTVGSPFLEMPALEYIERIILTNDGTQYMSTNFFQGCTSLKEVMFEGVIPTSLNAQWCPLTKDSILSIFNALSDVVTGVTLTLGLSAVNNAFETSEGAADGSTSDEWNTLIATKANWTISMV